MKKSFIVQGKVQGVMFRKSYCLAALQRGLLAGATNLDDRSKVLCSLEGSEVDMAKFMEEILECEKLNSWGANIISIEDVEFYKDLSEHDYDNRELNGPLSLNGVELLI